MNASAWIALVIGCLTVLINLVVVVRYVTRLEGRLDMQDFKIATVTDGLARVEKKIDSGKVVVFRGPRRGMSDEDEALA